MFNERELKLIDTVAEYLYIDKKIPEPSRVAAIRFAVMDLLIPLVISSMEVRLRYDG